MDPMEPVHPLRAHRRSRGWSLEDVAQRLQRLGYEAGTRGLGTDGATVGRWERGERSPRPPYPKLLCMLFEATPVELGLALSPHVPLCDTMEEVERRTIFRLLGGAVGAPLLVRGKAKAAIGAEAERLAHALSRPSGTDDGAVAVVEASIAAARRLDDVLGPRAAARAALAQRDIVRTLLAGGAPEAVKARLIVAAGQLSQLLGWLAQDMNDERTGVGFLHEAVKIAHEADDGNLGAYVMSHRSRLEVLGGRPQRGVAFAEAGRSWAEAKGSPATRSWLAIAEARALGKLSERSRAERALDRARAMFGRSKAENEPPWMYFYDGAELESMVGFVCLTLGLAEPARRAMEQGLATADASMVRDRAHRLALLGQTYVLDGEVDEACRLGGEALMIATATRSDGAVQYVRQLRAQLKPWESEAMIRDLDEQLAATSAWCRPVVA